MLLAQGAWENQLKVTLHAYQVRAQKYIERTFLVYVFSNNRIQILHEQCSNVSSLWNAILGLMNCNNIYEFKDISKCSIMTRLVYSKAKRI